MPVISQQWAPYIQIDSPHNRLTQAAQLLDDGRQGAVGDALQLAGDPIRQGAAAQEAGLDDPLHQRHVCLSGGRGGGSTFLRKSLSA